MLEFTTVHLAILASLFGAGLVLGWWFARSRSAREKLAINAGWQEQLDTRQAENDRLLEQNKGLMQQVSDYYATSNDSSNRTRELSATLRDTLAGREELQRRIRQARENLGLIAEQRDALRQELEALEARGAEQERALEEKDEKIFRLSQQLSSWQSRLAPLVEKFQERDREATELQDELDRAINRIAELEVLTRPDETQIEPIDEDAAELLRDASNDQYDDTTEQRSAGDDLKQIKGVGPAIERTLHELGIFRFEQLAGISEYDIDRIAARLRGLRSRIYREDWIGQARALLYGESPDPA